MIPLNKPYVPRASREYALHSLDSNHHHGDGHFSNLATLQLSKFSGSAEILLTPSCTHALEMASMLANLGPGDEVILPSFNFPSGATAIERFGAKPVFVDIDPTTKCIDIVATRAAITDKTKAISWVNYAGISPKLDELENLAKEFQLFLIEDNAHGLGGHYKGRPLGTFGDVSTLSFHSTKNVQCGEGGALVINNSDLFERAKVIREKGTNRSQFMLGAVEKYQWIDSGSSYLLADVLAAILLGQLESFSQIQKNRIETWQKYYNFFVSQNSELYTLPFADFARNSNLAHNFYLELQDEKARKQLIQILSNHGIQAAFHYQPLHKSLAGKVFPPYGRDLEKTEKVSASLLRLPLYYGIKDEIWPRLNRAIIEFQNS
jgi:dTDP-4-amino-4,6-dideoxygalactose transaminase